MNSDEPVLSAASISAAVSAIVALIVAFGVDLSEEQTAAIMGVVGVLAPIVLGIVARGRVTPMHRARPQRPPMQSGPEL